MITMIHDVTTKIHHDHQIETKIFQTCVGQDFYYSPVILFSKSMDDMILIDVNLEKLMFWTCFMYTCAPIKIPVAIKRERR